MFLWTTLAYLGVAVAVPIPWTSVVPDDATSYEGDKYVCLLDDIMYRAGDSVPAATPCERCVCEPPDVACAPVKCEKMQGCRALLKTNQCCPEYQCECERDGKIYNNGEKLESPHNPCEVCYCRGGEIVCTLITCYKRDDCYPQEVPGRCCPKYDHCPPLDSSASKMTTTRPATNSSSSLPSDESAVDNTLTTIILTAVTSSRRLTPPSERGQVTRVPDKASLSVELTTPSSGITANTTQDTEHLSDTSHAKNDEATSLIYENSQEYENANAEDTIAESSEHSPVEILPEYDIQVLVNDTDIKENGNATLDNAMYHEYSATNGSDNTSATEREIAVVLSTTTSESENSTAVEMETTIDARTEDVSSMEVTTEAVTTETNFVLATPTLTATSSVTYEPWEDQRPTQMVTDEIQYVTTIDPLISVADSKSTSPSPLDVVEEAKSNADEGAERTSDLSLERSAMESKTEANATAESADSTTDSAYVNSNEESSTVFDKLPEVNTSNKFNETEGSESESTDSSTQLTDTFTTMETLLYGMTSPSETDEADNERSINMTSLEDNDMTSELPVAMTTIHGEEEEGDPPVIADIEEEEDRLPVVKLSEEMANHQMDFVIHQIIVPTESDDIEESEMRVPVDYASSTTGITWDMSSIPTSSIGDEESTTATITAEYSSDLQESSTAMDDNQQLQINAQNTLHASVIDLKGKNDTGTIAGTLDISSETPNEDEATVMVVITDTTTLLPEVDGSDQQERTVSGNNTVIDENTVNTTISGDQGTDRMDTITDQEAEVQITDVPSITVQNNLPVQNGEVHTKEGNVSPVVLASLNDGESVVISTTEDVTIQSTTHSTVTEEMTEKIKIDTALQDDDESTNSITSTSEVSDKSDEITVIGDISAPTTSLPGTPTRVISRGNVVVLNDTLPVITNETSDEEEEIRSSNVTLTPEGMTEDQNSTETINKTEVIFDSTSFEFDETTEIQNIIDVIARFESNKSRVDDIGNTTELQEGDVQNNTLILITEEPADLEHIATVGISTSDSQDDLPKPEVKRETVLSNLPLSKLIHNPNRENVFTQLQREDAEEISKYDVTLLQNFFKNLYIHDDHSKVEVT